MKIFKYPESKVCVYPPTLQVFDIEIFVVNFRLCIIFKVRNQAYRGQDETTHSISAKWHVFHQECSYCSIVDSREGSYFVKDGRILWHTKCRADPPWPQQTLHLARPRRAILGRDGERGPSGRLEIYLASGEDVVGKAGRSQRRHGTSPQ